MALTPGNFELNQRNHNTIVKNLLKRTGELSPEAIKGGSAWYPSAQKDASFIGEQSGQGRLAGAAILGRLSPGQDWDMNRLMGIQTLHLDDKATNAISTAASIPREKDERMKELAKNERTRLRGVAGLPGTPLDNQTTDNINRSLEVRSGTREPMSVFTIKPKASRKVSDFALTIDAGGQHPHAVIDTHAYDAAMGSYRVPYGTGNEHMKKAGVYNFIQSAYAKAHGEAIKRGMIPETMSMGDFQAIHWLHQKQGKQEVNNRASGTSQGTGGNLERILATNPHLDPVRLGLDPIVSRSTHFTTGTGEGR